MINITWLGMGNRDDVAKIMSRGNDIAQFDALVLSVSQPVWSGSGTSFVSSSIFVFRSYNALRNKRKIHIYFFLIKSYTLHIWWMTTKICRICIEYIWAQTRFSTAKKNWNTHLYKNSQFYSTYLFSLIYEVDVCNVGEPFVFDACRDTDRIKLQYNKTIRDTY